MAKPGSKLTLEPHDTITEGDAVGVLLSNRPDQVWLERADYERIVATYGYRAWTWVKETRHVRVRPSKAKNVPVARLVLESDGTGFIHFADVTGSTCAARTCPFSRTGSSTGF